jgi:hypothetical protein
LPGSSKTLCASIGRTPIENNKGDVMLDTLIFGCLLVLLAFTNLIFYFIAGSFIKLGWRDGSNKIDPLDFLFGLFLLLASGVISLLTVKIVTLLPF